MPNQGLKAGIMGLPDTTSTPAFPKVGGTYPWWNLNISVCVLSMNFRRHLKYINLSFNRFYCYDKKINGILWNKGNLITVKIMKVEYDDGSLGKYTVPSWFHHITSRYF